MSMKEGYRKVFSQKQYMKLIFANIINRFGDSIDAIAFSWIAYEITGSASWLAIILGINSIPTIVFQPFMGAIVEHLQKKKVMVITDLIRGVLVTITVILYLMNQLNPYTLATITFLMSTVEAFRVPAGLAIVPKVLKKEYYTHGLSLSKTLSQLSQLIGMALAGPIIAVIGAFLAMIIDALTFFISAIIIMTLDTKEVIENKEKLNIKKYFITLKEGFFYLKSKTVVFVICMFGMIMSFLFIPLSILQVPYVEDTLGIGAIALTFIGIPEIVFMMIGSFIYPFIQNHVSKKIIMATSGVIIGIVYLLYAMVPMLETNVAMLTALVLISSLFGLATSGLTSTVNIAFMTHVEETYLSRAGSIFNALVNLATPLGSFVISLIIVFLPLQQILVLFGVLTIIAFGMMFLSKKLKEI